MAERSSTVLVALCVFLTGQLNLMASTKLNPQLVSGGGVTAHRIAPDSSRIVYRADQDVDDVFELYSIPFEGGPSTKISGPMTSGGDVEYLFEILPDSNRVIYFADQDTDDVLELYSTPIDGSSPPVKLSGPMVDGGDVDLFDFEVAADGSRVAYLADQEVDGVPEVFSTFTDGSGVPVRVNAPLIAGGEVKDFEISPDGQTVVYRAIQDTQFREDLYSRPIDGSGNARRLNGPLVRGGDVLFAYAIDPTSSHVVFRADQDVDRKVELFSRPLDGSGEPVRLNAPLASNDSRVRGFRLTPDGSQVIYTAQQDDANTTEVYVQAIDGRGTPLKISAPLEAGRNAFIDSVSADGNTIVYLADQDREDINEAFSVPVDGSQVAQKVNGPLVQDGRVIGGRISYDDERFIYFADAETVGTSEVFSSPLEGGEMVKINGPLPDGTSASAFALSFDSQFIVYLEGTIFSGSGLYAVPVTGGRPVRLDATLEGGSIEGLHEIAADNRTVIYRATQDELGVFELYSARIPYGICDFNENGMIDVGDLDLLSAQIQTSENFFPFDVTGDFQVDLKDLLEFVTSPDKLNTFIGDANLDGEFGTADLVEVFRIAEYEDGINGNSTWTEGDWNADGDFDTGDLVFAFQQDGYERGPRRVLAVPEPMSDLMSIIAFGLASFVRGAARRRPSSQLSSL